MKTLLALLSLGLSSSCVLFGVTPVPCVDDGDCLDDLVCSGGSCGPAVVAEGEGEGDTGEGEGEGEGDVGEGEGEGEGEGDTGEGEGEGDVGEGEGEGEGEGDVLSDCGNGVVEAGEECDGGASCAPGCFTVAGNVCGIDVPAEFLTAGVIVSAEATAGARCFGTIRDALNNGATAVFVGPGRYLEGNPLDVAVPLRGAGVEQVTIGSDALNDIPTMVLDGGAVVRQVTVQGGTAASASGVVVVDIGSGTVVVEDAAVIGRETLVFMNGGPDQLELRRLRLARPAGALNGVSGLFVGSSSTGVDIFVEESFFDGVGLSVNAAGTVVIGGNAFAVDNNIIDIDPSASSIVTVHSNEFVERGGCLNGLLDVEEGSFTLTGNTFRGPGCATLLSIGSAAVAVSLEGTGTGGNVFDGGGNDVVVAANITIPANGNDWSDDANPCAVIEVSAPGGSVVVEGQSCR